MSTVTSITSKSTSAASHGDRLLRLIRRKGLIRASDLDHASIPRITLTRLIDANKIERIGRGLYRLVGTKVSESEGLAIVSKKAPDAIICLLSALQFHGLTTQLPHQVWITIPAGGHVPQLDYPPIKTVRAGGDAYIEGIETHKIDGVLVRIYNLHKTIADCFKHRNKIGLDVAMEALRDAWAQRKLKMDTLTYYARINRVEKAMRPYLEMLVS